LNITCWLSAGFKLGVLQGGRKVYLLYELEGEGH